MRYSLGKINLFYKKAIVLVAVLFSISVFNLHAQIYFIHDVAGTGNTGSQGDGYPAIDAQLYNPWGATVDDSGNVYIADQTNGKIRKVDTKGIITTVVGTNTPIGPRDTAVWRTHGDGGKADTARLSDPLEIKFDSKGNMYIADWNNRRVRRVDKKTNIITTYAGNGQSGSTGDGGPAVNSSLTTVYDIAFDKYDNLYIADLSAFRIRKVDVNGIITTIAGDGIQNFSGDNGPAANAELRGPSSIAVDTFGNVYFQDGLARIRKIDLNGIITTVAGNGGNYSGDGGLAINAGINGVWDIAVDDSANIYFTEENANSVRKIYANTGIIKTIAGDGVYCFGCYYGNYVPALTAKFYFAQGISVDKQGNVFFTDDGNNKVRELMPCSSVTAFASDTPSLCKGGSVKLVATSANSYSWTPSTGLNTTKGNIVIANPGVTTTYTVTGSSCTATTATVVVKVDNLHTPPVIHVSPGNPETCLNSPVSLTASGGTNYLWANTTGIDCRSCASIMATPTDFTTPFKVIGYSSANCFDTTSILIHVDTLPNIVALPDTAPLVCPQTQIQLTATGGDTYVWSNGTGLSCTSCSSPVATITKNSFYQVIATNSFQCTAVNYVEIDVKSAGNPGEITAKRDTICMDTKGTVLTTGSSGTIQWLSSSSGSFNAIAGATDTSYSGILSQTTYFKTVADNGVCTDTSSAFMLVVEPLPSDSFVTSTSGRTASFTSFTSVGINSYHWDFGDDSTSSKINPTHTFNSGKDTFYVCLTVYNGSNCSYTRCNYISFAKTGVPSILSGGWKVYPVPTSDYLFINGSNAANPIQNIKVIDVLGRTVLNNEIHSSSNQIKVDVSGLTNGMYYLKIRTAGEEFVQAVVKQ